jgi:hypothetical protein
MLLQILKHGEIRLEALGFAPEHVCRGRELAFIRCALFRDRLTRLAHLTPVVNRFRRLLQAERNQQSDDDRDDVDEKVAPSVRCVRRWMNV